MDIIDQFVVTLGLDPSSYKKEMAGFRDDLRRTKEETARTTRDMESDGRRAAESFNRLKNEIVGLFLVVAGARSLGGLITDLIHGNAETGRFAANIGLATEEMSAWEGAVRSMGGTAEDARAALAALNAEYTSYMLTGRAVHEADLNALGISARDLQNPTELAMTLAERSEHMDRRQFTARLQRIGLPDSFIRTLVQGKQATRELIAEQYRLGVVTERDSRAAQEAERQWANLTTQLRGELRPALTWLVEEALPWLNEHGPAISRIVGVGMAGAFGLMALALVRAAGPLGIVVAGLTAIIELWPRMPHSFAALGAALQYQYMGIRAATIRQSIAAIPFTPGLNTPENRANGQRRSELMQELADIETRRLVLAREASGEDSGDATAPSAPVGGGGGGAGGNARYNQMRSFFQSRGYTGAQASGIAAGIMAESQGNPNSFNSAGGGQGAFGIGQWRGRRQDALFRQFGRHPTMDQQLQFFLSELRGGDPGGAAVGRASTADAALAAVVHGFFRPGAGAGGDIARGRGYLGGGAGGAARSAAMGRPSARWSPTYRPDGVHVGQIVVNVPHGTPRAQADAVAREVPRAIARRGVVTQANGGLR